MSLDPFSWFALVGVADVITRLGVGLRQLQQQYSGALDAVDNIAQQVGNIELAIREICSLLRSSPSTFPASFDTRLEESAAAIGKVVSQIQDHVQCVQAVSEKSANRGKIRHVWNSGKVTQWEKNLGVQVQALSLLLQVAQMRSNDERASVLENDSSKRLFEKASSMSAKMGESSGTPSSGRRCPADVKSFAFDPTLLGTKVYRRACESIFRREITITGSPVAGSISDASSGSSNQAIAGDNRDTGPDSSAFVDIQPASEVTGLALEIVEEHRTTTSVTEGVASSDEVQLSDNNFQLVSESSTLGTSGFLSRSSDQQITNTTLATTMNSLELSKSTGEASSLRNGSEFCKSTLLVTVETVGSDQLECCNDNGHDHYEVLRDSIHAVKDTILTCRGIDPASYRGKLISCTIETCGQANHQFPFTATFLAAALEKMEDGFYSAIDINARFSPSPTPGEHQLGTHMEIHSKPAPEFQGSSIFNGVPNRQQDLSLVPHIHLGDTTVLPFLDWEPDCKGGFGEVYRVKIHPQFLDIPDPTLDGHYAVKRLFGSVGYQNEAFCRESDALRRLSSDSRHPHLIRLLATFEQKQRETTNFYLLFPWADGGNLRDYWKNNEPYDRGQQAPRRSFHDAVEWVSNQTAGLVDAVSKLHANFNGSDDPGIYSSSSIQKYGRHGDLKPENILVFGSRLVITDFGLAHFHASNEKAKVDHHMRKACTRAYRAPEYDYMPDENYGPAVDVWSLGCIFLEAATWVLRGRNGLRKFTRDRRSHARDLAFFTNNSGKCSSNPAVDLQLEKLWAEARNLRPPTSDLLISFLKHAKHCLEINQEDRPSSEALAKRFQSLCEMLSLAREDNS